MLFFPIHLKFKCTLYYIRLRQVATATISGRRNNTQYKTKKMSKLKWLLDYHFVRGDYVFCEKIIQDMLAESKDQQEYTNYIQVNF